MLYRREGKNIKSEEKVERDLAANVITVLLDWSLNLKSIVRLCKPSIGNVSAGNVFVWW